MQLIPGWLFMYGVAGNLFGEMFVKLPASCLLIVYEATQEMGHEQRNHLNDLLEIDNETMDETMDDYGTGYGGTHVRFWGGLLFLCQLNSLAACVCFHRYFAHSAFETSRLGRAALAIVGCFSAQRGALWWAGNHRQHHIHCDEPEDLHSPKQKGRLYAHVGWLTRRENYGIPVEKLREFLGSPELFFIEVFSNIIAICWIVGIVVPFFGTFRGKLAVALANNAMWAINSLCHVKVGDQEGICHARDLWWLGVINGGEGFHSAHHDSPGCANHGRRHWYNFDISYMLILSFERLGLVWNVQHPGEPDSRKARHPAEAFWLEPQAPGNAGGMFAY